MAANQLDGGELHRVLSRWITGTNTHYAVLPSRRVIPRRTSTFLEFMTIHARAMVKQKGNPFEIARLDYLT